MQRKYRSPSGRSYRLVEDYDPRNNHHAKGCAVYNGVTHMIELSNTMCVCSCGCPEAAEGLSTNRCDCWCHAQGLPDVWVQARTWVCQGMEYLSCSPDPYFEIAVGTKELCERAKVAYCQKYASYVDDGDIVVKVVFRSVTRLSYSYPSVTGGLLAEV